MTVGETDGVPDDLADDPEACLEFLVDRDVLVEDEQGVRTTLEFEDTRGVYHDSYADEDEATIRETVADLFDLTEEEAARRMEELDVTRDEVVTYLSLRSFLDADLSNAALGVAAGIVTEVTPESPVPQAMPELDDADFESFVDEAGDAVVFVMQRYCEPCRAIKKNLGELRAATPDRVAFAGVDGDSEDVMELRREYDVEAAPTMLMFADGELAASYRGWKSVDAYREAVADVYD